MICETITSVANITRKEMEGNVMPEWLLFVISGILAGGIPGFRI